MPYRYKPHSKTEGHLLDAYGLTRLVRTRRPELYPRRYALRGDVKFAPPYVPKSKREGLVDAYLDHLTRANKKRAAAKRRAKAGREVAKAQNKALQDELEDGMGPSMSITEQRNKRTLAKQIANDLVPVPKAPKRKNKPRERSYNAVDAMIESL